MAEEKNSYIGAWVTPKLKEEARQAAEAEKRSLSNLLVVALENYLNQQRQGEFAFPTTTGAIA